MASEQGESKEEFPNIDWGSVLPKLPKDNDGYVKSFEVILNSDDEKAMEQNKRDIQDFFNKYGVVVIRNVLSRAEAGLSCKELFDFVESSFEGLDRNDPNTWHKVSKSSAKLGMIGDFPVMSPQLVKNRMNEKLYTAYSYILDTDISNIYTNIGRVGWMRPTKNIRFADDKIEDRPQWKTQDGTTWLHMDMDPITNHCTTLGLMPNKLVKHAEIDSFAHVRTQGILALDDCGISDGGFQCVPGFHNILQSVWVKESGKENIAKRVFQHRYQFKSTNPVIKYITKCPLRRGSFLVWDSRLPHNNFPNDSNHGRKNQYIKYARYDDEAVKPVRFGVEQSGPWGMWPLTLEFPFDDVELNGVTKRIYGIGVADVVSESKQSKNKLFLNCILL